ncbi:MAG: hypothetical protein M0Z77_04650 [Thermoplasmatales archaeon]|nr:hypothetical protein [Thermoplasmatales archaeon]
MKQKNENTGLPLYLGLQTLSVRISCNYVTNVKMRTYSRMCCVWFIESLYKSNKVATSD